ncbi:energy transducer TonB [Paucimonas lemoignei]|nr:energy transducer TonB [Paucimonas lemoignei]
MNKRYLVKILAALVSVILHAAITISLSHDFTIKILSPQTEEQVMQVTLNSESSLLSKDTSGVDQIKAIQKDASEHAVRNETNVGVGADIAVQTYQYTGADAFHASSSIERENFSWEEWLPQLSNSPLRSFFNEQEVLKENTYLPGRELDERPEPEAPVIIPFPDAPEPKGKISAILVLFVNSSGGVDHIEIEASELSGAYEKTAIETFMSAKMRPGIKNGKPVPSKIKIEVTFEAK